MVYIRKWAYQQIFNFANYSNKTYSWLNWIPVFNNCCTKQPILQCFSTNMFCAAICQTFLLPKFVLYDSYIFIIGIKQYYHNINALKYLLLQYNALWLEKILIYWTIQYIVMYCNALHCFCLNVVFNHHTAKMTGPLVTWIIHSSSLLIYSYILCFTSH